MTVNEWELQTNSNVVSANKVVNSAKQLRCYIDAMLKQTVDDLKAQKDATNEAFRQRIEETREAKIKLELQHSEVKDVPFKILKIKVLFKFRKAIKSIYSQISVFPKYSTKDLEKD